MRADQLLAIVRKLTFERGANRAIGSGVVFLLLAKTEAQKHPQAIRFECENRMRFGEKENLLRSRVPNARKLLERSLGARRDSSRQASRLPSNSSITVSAIVIKVETRRSGCIPPNSATTKRSSREAVRMPSGAVPTRLSSMAKAWARLLGHVLPQHEAECRGHGERGRPSVVFLESIDNLSERQASRHGAR